MTTTTAAPRITYVLTPAEDEAVGQLTRDELRQWKILVGHGLAPSRALEQLRAEYLTQSQVLPAIARERRMREWHW